MASKGNHPRLRERISSRFYKIWSNEIFCAREASCLPVQIPPESRYVTKLWSVTRTAKPKLIGECLRVHTKLRFQKVKGESRVKKGIWRLLSGAESPRIRSESGGLLEEGGSQLCAVMRNECYNEKHKYSNRDHEDGICLVVKRRPVWRTGQKVQQDQRLRGNLTKPRPSLCELVCWWKKYYCRWCCFYRNWRSNWC